VQSRDNNAFACGTSTDQGTTTPKLGSISGMKFKDHQTKMDLMTGTTPVSKIGRLA
jgi:hypothetical protein